MKCSEPVAVLLAQTRYLELLKVYSYFESESDDKSLYSNNDSERRYSFVNENEKRFQNIIRIQACITF